MLRVGFKRLMLLCGAFSEKGLGARSKSFGHEVLEIQIVKVRLRGTIVDETQVPVSQGLGGSSEF